MGFEVRPSLLAYHAVALKNLAAGEDNRFPRNVRIYIYTKLNYMKPDLRRRWIYIHVNSHQRPLNSPIVYVTINFKIQVFCFVRPSKLVKSYRRFGGVQCVNSQGQLDKADHSSYIDWSWRYTGDICRNVGKCDVTSQKYLIFINAAT